MPRSNAGVSPCRGCHYVEITTTSVQPNGDKALLSQTTTPIRLSALDSASIEEVRLKDYKNGRDPRHSYTRGDYDVELVRLRAEVDALQRQATQKDQELRYTQTNVTRLEAELAQYHQQSTKVATDNPVTSALPAMLEPFAARMQAVEKQLVVFTESLEKSCLMKSAINLPTLEPIEPEKRASASAEKERKETETDDNKISTLQQKRGNNQSEVEQAASNTSSPSATVFTPASGASTPQGGDAEEFSQVAPNARVADGANANLSYMGHDGAETENDWL
ncbi:hypothetical protein LTR05_000928 [Lithohypha guttulata]|uniref:Uncharacterized protein n=1 Tax=Lithohypha guttulata TaxID=1690604 RepID=A0AAN7YEG0_9EURO|nr:hypothetical protein LTR05_000928 [Lithohypha guttulata]